MTPQTTPIPKIILKMSLKAEGCNLQEAMNDVHRAMLGFGQELHREDRHLDVVMVPEIDVPLDLDDLLRMEGAINNTFKWLDMAEDHASEEEKSAIFHLFMLLIQQRTKLQLVIQSMMESASSTLSEPQEAAVNLG